MNNEYDGLKYIIHFVEDRYDLNLTITDNENDMFLIQAEFPYLELYEKEWFDGQSNTYSTCLRIVGDISDEHMTLYMEDTA